MDPGLLDNARAAAAKVIDAEKQVVIAKAEYHAEVRRLHLAGASLREIAAALGMSHQRVQQIVDDAGGSWWTKVWRNRREAALRSTPCSFCARTRDQVDKLISGPHVFICNRCIEIAERVAKQRSPQSPFGLAPRADTGRCSFCGLRPGSKRVRGGGGAVVRPMLAAGAHRVCTDCLRECRSILDDGPPSATSRA